MCHCVVLASCCYRMRGARSQAMCLVAVPECTSGQAAGTWALQGGVQHCARSQGQWRCHLSQTPSRPPQRQQHVRDAPPACPPLQGGHTQAVCHSCGGGGLKAALRADDTALRPRLAGPAAHPQAA